MVKFLITVVFGAIIGIFTAFILDINEFKKTIEDSKDEK